MARSAAAMAVAMVVLVAMAAVVPSANAAPCGSILAMQPCLQAARTGEQPPNECCTAIAKYAQGGTPEGEACLCAALTNPTATAAGINLKYAVLIPSLCKLSYKAGYVCNNTPIPGGHA